MLVVHLSLALCIATSFARRVHMGMVLHSLVMSLGVGSEPATMQRNSAAQPAAQGLAVLYVLPHYGETPTPCIVHSYAGFGDEGDEETSDQPLPHCHSELLEGTENEVIIDHPNSHLSGRGGREPRPQQVR